jgi:hypothetical protein
MRNLTFILVALTISLVEINAQDSETRIKVTEVSTGNILVSGNSINLVANNEIVPKTILIKNIFPDTIYFPEISIPQFVIRKRPFFTNPDQRDFSYEKILPGETFELNICFDSRNLSENKEESIEIIFNVKGKSSEKFNLDLVGVVCNDVKDSTIFDIKICAGDIVELEVPEGISHYYFSNGSQESHVTLGSGYIHAFYWEKDGVWLRDTMHQTIYPLPIVDAGKDQTVFESSTNLFAESANHTDPSALWKAEEGISFEDFSNPQSRVGGLSSGDNILTWNITNSFGCTASDSVIITCEKITIIDSAEEIQISIITSVENIYIELPLKEEVRIYNLRGKLVLTSSGRYHNFNLPSGIYIVISEKIGSLKVYVY